MKVGIFSPYWQTFGGGERYVLTVAEFFLMRGDNVDIFWNGDQDVNKIRQRFDIDLQKANFVRDIFHNHTNFFRKTSLTASYDLIFFLSDGSVPFSLAKANILHFQQPFHYNNQQTVFNKVKLARFGSVVCNSKFTKHYIDKTYGLESLVLYPPVDVTKFVNGPKEKIILSVGRFFGPSNPKKQEVIIDTFKKMKLPGWRLILVGGLTNGSLYSLESLKHKTAGFPIELVTDSTFASLKNYYAQAAIFWHATGFGEDLRKFPERAEHFGITTVEAMSAAVVPIVFAGGGQKEIITEGKDGFFWTSTAQLIKKTLQVAADQKLRQKISQQAIKRAKFFSKEKFFQHLSAIVETK